jgi:acyl-coenzyme A thioesterase PaaI-like protein
MGAVTIEMKTSFMQAAKGLQRARGRLLHRTATMAFTEGHVFDVEGRLCAHATGTFKYVKRLPVGAKGVQSLNAPATGISTD